MEVAEEVDVGEGRGAFCLGRVWNSFSPHRHPPRPRRCMVATGPRRRALYRRIRCDAGW